MLIRLLLILFCLALPLAAVAEEEEKKAPPIYHALPKLVVNVDDGRRVRFMQVELQVMTRDKGVITALEHHQPAVRHALIMLLTAQEASTLYSTEGREEVRREALAAVQETLAEVAGLQSGVEALYFNNFVIQ